jgi:hypothetical protein
MARDSMNMKKASPGSRKETGLFSRLACLIEFTVSTMNQIRVTTGVNTSRNNRMLNPASVRLNLKIKSKLAPRIRRIVN